MDDIEKRPEIGTKRKTYTKLDFTLEEEEELIDFVKSNPELFNPQNEHFKNKMFRDRLWAQFGEKIDKKGKFVCEIQIVLLLMESPFYRD